MPAHAPVPRRTILSALSLAAITVALVPLPAAAFKLEGAPKIAFIYGATAKDGGWNEALDSARAAVEQELGLTVAVTENVPEEATALKNAIDLYVKRGFNIIVGTTYGYSDGILEAAKSIPTWLSSTRRAPPMPQTSKGFTPRADARQRLPGAGGGRGARASGRKWRRQVDADERPGRDLCGRCGRDPSPGRAGSYSPACRCHSPTRGLDVAACAFVHAMLGRAAAGRLRSC